MESDNFVKIAIDAMGCDHGIEVAVKGAALFLEKSSDAYFLFFGDKEVVQEIVAKYPILDGHNEVIHSSEVVSHDVKPSAVLRYFVDSSMRMAIGALADHKAHAVVSSGNTGALMVMARAFLRCLQGVDRPAISALFPAMNDKRYLVIDVGANVDCTPQMLIQFAIMGCIYNSIVSTEANRKNPRVALLNIGSEVGKGTTVINTVYPILASIASQIGFEFVGYIEPKDVVRGAVDVLIADGFIGNIMLKTVESYVGYSVNYIREYLVNNGGLDVLSNPYVEKALISLLNEISPAKSKGGVFLGVNGTVVKCHGAADAVEFCDSIVTAYSCVIDDIGGKIDYEIGRFIELIKSC